MLDRNLVLPHLLAHRAEERGDKTFIDVVGGGSVTYAEFHEESLRWANALLALGAVPGSQVAAMLPVGLDGFLAWLGISWMGARTVPISIAHRGRVLRHVLANSAATHLVISQRYVDRLGELTGDLPGLTTVIVCDSDEPECALPVRVVGRDEFLRGIEPSALPGPEYRDVAGIFYTSGTTGPSKGVLVPWAHLHATASCYLDGLDESDAWYSPLPQSHISGTAPMYTMALVGGRLVLREVFSTTEFLDEVTKYGCTAAIVMGAMPQFLMSQPPTPHDADSPLRHAAVNPIPPDIEDFKARFGVRVFTGYNMTEMSAPITSPGWTVTGEKYSSCGRVRPGYQVRIVDEHDEELPPGTVGELIVRADEPWVMNVGYLNMPEATADAWRHGWFHTGDALMCDDDGDFYFVDRLKDAIRRRGENISSAEVEIEVSAFPAVAECAAVAAPSEWGEDEVKVFVIAKPDTNLDPVELIEFLRPRMAHYMIPRFVEIVDELPRTNTFKVMKHELRDRGNSDATWDREAAGIVVKREA
jgi:crotonobetaine/carnitine-CoA ligase